MKLTPEQYSLLESRAGECQVKVAYYIRSIIVQVVRTASEGRIRVREPDGSGL